jgi:hypothetical protein
MAFAHVSKAIACWSPPPGLSSAAWPLLKARAVAKRRTDRIRIEGYLPEEKEFAERFTSILSAFFVPTFLLQTARFSISCCDGRPAGR